MDDIALTLVSVRNPAPSAGHFNRALLGTFSQAPRFLRDVSELVTLNPLLSVPIRDVNDVVVVQTALIGEADVICTNDEDFYDPGLTRFLTRVGISVTDDVTLMHRMRS